MERRQVENRARTEKPALVKRSGRRILQEQRLLLRQQRLQSGDQNRRELRLVPCKPRCL